MWELGGPTTPESALQLRTQLAARIETSLRLLAERVMRTNLLRKTYSVTAAAGEASLTTPPPAEPEPMILEGLKLAQVYIDGFTLPAQYAADRSGLMLDQTDQFARWTLENQTVVIRDATGLDHYAGPITIRNAPYIPTLANVPVSLDAVLVKILAGTFTETPAGVSDGNTAMAATK
jgi:hypothetical protein